MSKAEEPFTGGSGGAANAETARGTPDRRRPTVARFRFQPDPRRIRALLAEVDGGLASADPMLRRNVRLLVGEIVARLLRAHPQMPVVLDLEVKVDSARIDILGRGTEQAEFWDALDDTVFSDLTAAWGRDRRRNGGAWFEVTAATRAYPRTAAR